MQRFQFLDPGELVDGDLRLALALCYQGNAALGMVPSYEFHMRRVPDGVRLGAVSLRIGESEHMIYVGNIGYGVAEEHRGHRYAARSTLLLVPLARRHGLTELWITTDPDNWASQRTIELVGGQYVESVLVPPHDSLYGRGDRIKLRYRVPIGPESGTEQGGSAARFDGAGAMA
ncbi:MAG: GNAT family N-acetyltransferase [Chloroflexi bacterium]|jgi:predicted acetyltransferase|nr:GNAT family N-acetyltransferase [Chloroflexota bacterium]